MLLGGAALDQVGGQRERRPGEPDQRRGAELGDQLPDGGLEEAERARAPAAAARRRRRPMRTGWATTGPTPGLISMSTPATTSGSTMSENRIAASTPCRRTGCRVISVTRSGSWQACEHRRPRAQRPVLRQRPSRLPHEPHRGAAAPAVHGRRGRGRSRPGTEGRQGRLTTGHPPRRRRTTAVRRPQVTVRRVGRDAPQRRIPCAAWSRTQPGDRRGPQRRGRRRSTSPRPFRAALEALAAVRARPEIELEHIPAPPRLAPYAHAIGAHVGERRRRRGRSRSPARGSSCCYDPAGHDAWHGTIRCVGYLSAATDEQMVDDTMFSEVAWSWLTDALTESGAAHHAVGGTVTRTASTRFGDLAGPEHTVDVEMRASWTAEDTDLDRHLLAWLEVLGNAAGLPPPGVRLLGHADRPGGETPNIDPAAPRRAGIPPLSAAGRAGPGGRRRRPYPRGRAARTRPTEDREGGRQLSTEPDSRGPATRRRPMPRRPPRRRKPRHRPPSRCWPHATGCRRSSRTRTQLVEPTPRRCARAPDRSPSTPSGPRATATGSAPTWCSCAATARAPA